MAKRIIKHELIEITIPAGNTSTRIMIPDQPNLRNAFVTGIETYSADNMPLSPISSEALVSETDLKKIFLTLVDNAGVEFVHIAPAKIYKTIQDTANANIERDFKALNGQFVNWPKSYITLSQSLGNVGVLSVVVSVFYFEQNNPNTPFNKRK